MNVSEPREYLEEILTNYPLRNGNTLLFAAIRQQNIKMIVDLICAKANVNNTNDIGITPLMTSLNIPHSIESTVVLIAADAKLSQSDFDKVSAYKHLSVSLLDLLKCVVSNSKKRQLQKNNVCVSNLLGKISFAQIKKIKNMKRMNLNQRLHAAANFAKTLKENNGDKNEWNELLEGQANTYRIERMKQFNAQMDGGSLDNDDESSNVNGTSNVKSSNGSMKIFPKLKLYQMTNIPKRARFETGLGVERQQKGVRIISETFKRIEFIQNVQDGLLLQ